MSQSSAHPGSLPCPEGGCACAEGLRSSHCELFIPTVAVGWASGCPHPSFLMFYFSGSPPVRALVCNREGNGTLSSFLIQSQREKPRFNGMRRGGQAGSGTGKDICRSGLSVRYGSVIPRNLSCECVRIRDVQQGPRGLWAIKAARRAGPGV